MTSAENDSESSEDLLRLAACREILRRKDLLPSLRTEIRVTCDDIIRLRPPVAVHAEALVIYVLTFKGYSGSNEALVPALRAEELADDADDPRLAFEARCLWLHCAAPYAGAEECARQLKETTKYAATVPQEWREWAQDMVGELAAFCATFNEVAEQPGNQ